MQKFSTHIHKSLNGNNRKRNKGIAKPGSQESDENARGRKEETNCCHRHGADLKLITAHSIEPVDAASRDRTAASRLTRKLINENGMKSSRSLE
jgi:hypothetical protein